MFYQSLSFPYSHKPGENYSIRQEPADKKPFLLDEGILISMHPTTRSALAEFQKNKYPRINFYSTGGYYIMCETTHRLVNIDDLRPVDAPPLPPSPIWRRIR